MNYYPVFIPTLNRFEHFRKCVESLSKCTHADKTELIIGLDFPPSTEYIHGYYKIKEYVYQIQGFKSVTIVEHATNMGAVKNWLHLKRLCFERYEACIGSEDDNIFSPCFLDYMNKALDKYQINSRILSITGYNHTPFYNQGTYSCYESKDSCAWGIGMWKNKEIIMEKMIEEDMNFNELIHSFRKASYIYFTYPALYNMLCDMVNMKARWGDVMRTSFSILNGYRQLHPSVSLVRNCGFDGSGVHCGVDSVMADQIISESLYFNLGKSARKLCTINNIAALHFQGLPNNNEGDEIQNIRRLLFANVFQVNRSNLSIRILWEKALKKMIRIVDIYLNKVLFYIYKHIV